MAIWDQLRIHILVQSFLFLSHWEFETAIELLNFLLKETFARQMRGKNMIKSTEMKESCVFGELSHLELLEP